jgi:DNA-binding XRE family transcriptional regulator
MIPIEKMAAAIRATRAALDMNQAQFAKLVGLSRPTIARLEENPLKSKAHNYFTVQHVVEKTLSDLIKF